MIEKMADEKGGEDEISSSTKSISEKKWIDFNILARKAEGYSRKDVISLYKDYADEENWGSGDLKEVIKKIDKSFMKK